MIELKRFVEVNNHQILDLGEKNYLAQIEEYEEVHMCASADCSLKDAVKIIQEIAIYEPSINERLCWNKLGIITNQWDRNPLQQIIIKSDE